VETGAQVESQRRRLPPGQGGPTAHAVHAPVGRAARKHFDLVRPVVGVHGDAAPELAHDLELRRQPDIRVHAHRPGGQLHLVAGGIEMVILASKVSPHAERGTVAAEQRPRAGRAGLDGGHSDCGCHRGGWVVFDQAGDLGHGPFQREPAGGVRSERLADAQDGPTVADVAGP